MKKKGFTLIELLAVIVILAIIALIATPIVMNVIENSRKGAAERSAENYLSAVETAIAVARLEEQNLPSGTYTVDTNGNLVNGDTTLKVDVNGTKPEVGSKVEIEGYEIKKTGINSGISLTIGNYTISYDEEGKIESTKSTDSNNPVVVYRWSEDEVEIGDELSSFTYVENPSDLGQTYFLKHVLNENNEVTESYACVKYSDNEEPACVRGGSGEYYGYAENPDDYTGNVLVLKSLDDKDFGCDITAETSSCSINSASLFIGFDGYVESTLGAGVCSVYTDGMSECASW